MADLSLRHIYKVYDGEVKAVNDFCMDIKDKEFIVFVGPSGCGKSTTLRMIAGLEEISAGELRIDGEVVNDLEPKDRNIAMVFQNYALYPHMTVYENMAFALKTAKVPKDIIKQKVTEAAEILGITQYLERKPKALSGGQRQRVALGRAIVRNPKVFLLDEPLSNLDAKLRAAMRAEISRLHEKLQTTFIYVTHDQTEAMTMGTRIVVMKDGFVQQIDTPRNLFRNPINMFVASFIGTPQICFFDGVIYKESREISYVLDCGIRINVDFYMADKIPEKYTDGKHRVAVGIRPDDVRIDDGKYKTDEWEITEAPVVMVESLGGENLVYTNLYGKNSQGEDGTLVVKTGADCEIHKGDIVKIAINKRNIYVFDRETEMNIISGIPKENIVDCELVKGKMQLGNNSFNLPKAIYGIKDGKVKVRIPSDGVILGEGSGKGKIARVEIIDDKVLYRLEYGNYDKKDALFPLFVYEDGKQCCDEGDNVNFDIDFSKISIDERNITPLNTVNSVKCSIVKVREKNRKYTFYFDIAGELAEIEHVIREKLFAARGIEIFDTEPELIFDAFAVAAEKSDNPSRYAFLAEITEILDYGRVCFGKADLGESSVVFPYSGNVGDTVSLKISAEGVTVKDRKQDIIIV